MKSTLSVNLLCNSELAVPAISVLLSQKIFFSIGMPRKAINRLNLNIQLAHENHISVTAFSEESFEKEVKQWLIDAPCDVVFVMTFPYKIPSTVLAIPTHGFLNFHYGLLPQYRSADPIFWQIRNGESYGGITVHQMDENWDSGPVLFTKKLEIKPNHTHGLHLNNLAQFGGAVLCDVIKLLEHPESLRLQRQTDGRYWKKPELTDVRIHWMSQNAAAIQALINACNPWNKGALTLFHISELRIVEAIVSNPPEILKNHLPGSLIIKNGSMWICCAHQTFIQPTIFWSSDGFFSSNTAIKWGMTHQYRFN